MYQRTTASSSACTCDFRIFSSRGVPGKWIIPLDRSCSEIQENYHFDIFGLEYEQDGGEVKISVFAYLVFIQSANSSIFVNSYSICIEVVYN